MPRTRVSPSHREKIGGRQRDQTPLSHAVLLLASWTASSGAPCNMPQIVQHIVLRFDVAVEFAHRCHPVFSLHAEQILGHGAVTGGASAK